MPEGAKMVVLPALLHLHLLDGHHLRGGGEVPTVCCLYPGDTRCLDLSEISILFRDSVIKYGNHYVVVCVKNGECKSYINQDQMMHML